MHNRIEFRQPFIHAASRVQFLVRILWRSWLENNS